MTSDAEDEGLADGSPKPPGSAAEPKTSQEMRVAGYGPRLYKLGPGRNARFVYARFVYRARDLMARLESFRFQSTRQYET
jgi:hypothetical protein